MRALILSILFFSSVAGAVDLFTPRYPANDPEFTDYIEDFISRSHDFISHKDFEKVPISFKPLDYSEKGSGTIGVCNWGLFNRTNRIEIDPKFWEQAGPFQKWYVFVHEVGHCLCNRNHPDIKETAGWFIHMLNDVGIANVRNPDHYLHDGCPVSIMYPHTFSSECLHDHQEMYAREMFDNCKPTPLPRPKEN